ncbi:hypothetical protein OG871_39805 (plasmid) [Kitasatospora sp. NBC_00374]|uniref:DUF6919 domain-containing protein n=1 Tax=Kitasatospora sp. NBC_00374 TaxID=2975964 RepID=UPI002F907C20
MPTTASTPPSPAPTAPDGPSAATPRSLAEVAGVVANWMDGRTRLLSCVSYHVPTGAESGPTALLADLNRAGLLTLASQYGQDTKFHGDGSRSTRRAAVDLLVPGRQLRRRLRTQARAAGLIVTTHRFPRFTQLTGLGGLTVSLLDSEPDASFGARRDRDELRRLLPGVGPAVLREAASARQITVADPDWGRNDRLWPLLQRFAAPAATERTEPVEPRDQLIGYGESAHLDTDVLEELTARTEDAQLNIVEQVLRQLPTTSGTLDREQVLHVLQAMRHHPQDVPADEQPEPPADLLAAYTHVSDLALRLTDALDDFHTSLVHGVQRGAGPELVRRAVAVAAAAVPLEGTMFPRASDSLR